MFASTQMNFKPEKFSWTLQKYETVGGKHTGTFENIPFIDPSNTWLINEAGCSLQDIAATYLVGWAHASPTPETFQVEHKTSK